MLIRPLSWRRGRPVRSFLTSQSDHGQSFPYFKSLLAQRLSRSFAPYGYEAFNTEQTQGVVLAQWLTKRRVSLFPTLLHPEADSALGELLLQYVVSTLGATGRVQTFQTQVNSQDEASLAHCKGAGFIQAVPVELYELDADCWRLLKQQSASSLSVVWQPVSSRILPSVLDFINSQVPVERRNLLAIESPPQPEQPLLLPPSIQPVEQLKRWALPASTLTSLSSERPITAMAALIELRMLRGSRAIELALLTDPAYGEAVVDVSLQAVAERVELRRLEPRVQLSVRLPSECLLQRLQSMGATWQQTDFLLAKQYWEQSKQSSHVLQESLRILTSTNGGSATPA